MRFEVWGLGFGSFRDGKMEVCVVTSNWQELMYYVVVKGQKRPIYALVSHNLQASSCILNAALWTLYVTLVQ